MKQKSFALTLSVIFLAATSMPASAETVELITYYPTQSNLGNAQLDNIDAQTITSEVLTLEGTANDPTVLLVEGANNIVSNVVFIPGSGATSEIRLGIGTDTPASALHIADGDLTIEGSIHMIPPSNQMHKVIGIDPIPNLAEGFRISSGNSDPATGGFGLNQFDDFLVFEKTDLDDNDPDGGIVFINTGGDDAQEVALVVRGDNSIGIGTIDPLATLHIQDEGEQPTIRLEGRNPAIIMQDTSTDAGSPGTSDFRLIAANGAGRMISRESIAVFIDSDDDATDEFFSIARNSTNFNNTEYLFTVTENGNTGLSTSIGILRGTSAPNSQEGNLFANDIYLRASNQWLSEQTGGNRIATGSYTGTGNDTNRFIDVGFSPRYVEIIHKHGGHRHVYRKYRGQQFFSGEDPNTYSLREDDLAATETRQTYLNIVDGEDGFRVGANTNSTAHDIWQTNLRNNEYTYVAME